MSYSHWGLLTPQIFQYFYRRKLNFKTRKLINNFSLKIDAMVDEWDADVDSESSDSNDSESDSDMGDFELHGWIKLNTVPFKNK